MRACIEGPSPSAESVRVLDLSQKLPRQHRVYGFPVASSLPGEAMADSFIFQIDWATVAMAIGAVASVVGAVFYGQRDGITENSRSTSIGSKQAKN
jgi:hypothetical protein